MANKIIVCYLRAGSAVLDDHILNRLAKYFAPRFDDNSTPALDPVVHVELFFPNTKNPSGGMSAGIHYGGKAFIHPKKFTRKNWVFHAIPATAAQIQRAKQFCERQRGSPFNHRGFYLPTMFNWSHASRVSGIHNNRKMPWYCSELVAYTLMDAGILNREQTLLARTHPNATHHVIQNNCVTFVDCARVFKGKALHL